MTRGRVEAHARDLIEKYGILDPPVPVEDIATSEGALIARNHFAGTESGFALRDGNQWVIGINTATSRRRQRFSIAHELGHLLMHEGKPLIVDHSVLINRRDDLSTAGTDRQEIEANGFAAAILMPRDMLLRTLRTEIEIAQFDSRDELIARMARIFDVSTEAMGYRLINLNIISA